MSTQQDAERCMAIVHLSSSVQSRLADNDVRNEVSLGVFVRVRHRKLAGPYFLIARLPAVAEKSSKGNF